MLLTLVLAGLREMCLSSECDEEMKFFTKKIN